LRFKPKHLLFSLISIVIIAIGGLAYLINGCLSEGLPSIDELENPDQSLATRVYSEDGELLKYFSTQKRVNLSIDEMPADYIRSLIATEDREFYNHWGVHIGRTVRAVSKTILNVVFGVYQKEGGSTITQQLARKLFIGQENTVCRKVREMATAIQIEQRYTKQEILEMYINTVYYGASAYGLDISAKAYFGKQPSELTMSEIAYLIGVVKGPNVFDVFKHPERALRRRNIVLSMMRDHGVISDDEFWEFSAEEIAVIQKNSKARRGGIAPHFVELIRQKFRDEKRFKKFNILSDGLSIKTTLNARIQRFALAAADSQVNYYQRLFDRKFKWNNNKKLLSTIMNEAISRDTRYRKSKGSERAMMRTTLWKNKSFTDSVKNAVTTIQCGIVVLDPKTGAVKAMVGASPKFMKENFHARHSLNHVTQIRRQPGSSVKPFVYAMAIASGLTPDSLIDCGPMTFTDPVTSQTWSPRTPNKDCDSTNLKTLSEGLRRSINSIAARLITEHTSPALVKDLMQKAGVESPLLAVPALALGAGGEIKPIELASSYSIFANNGYHVQPFYIKNVEDQYNSTIFNKNKTNMITDALDSRIANTICSMMEAVVDRGTGVRVRRILETLDKRALRDVDCAGKTGTTNGNADAWFTGFTPELICGVWVGFDDHRITFDAIGDHGQGGRVSAPIFGMILKDVYNSEELKYNKLRYDWKLGGGDTLLIGGAKAVVRTKE
jgi:penicillin-binding protein 1A